MDNKIHKRIFANLSSPDFDGLEDKYGILSFSPQMLDVFRADPFARPDDVVQVIGSVDGVAAGSVFSLPLEVRIGDEVHRTAAGCEMTVIEKFRNRQFGLKIPIARLKATAEKFMIGCSQSQMMIKVSEFIGSTIFYSPRMIMLFSSRSVVEMKFHGALLWIIRHVVDCGLCCYWWLVRLYTHFVLRNYELINVTTSDEGGIRAVADIIQMETTSCGEVHDEKWLKWHLSTSFSKNGPLTLTLLRKSGSSVAFFMTKRRFHEQASHRGFKNVWLGSVVEWGAVSGYTGIINPMLLMAASSFAGLCDAVEIVATETDVEKYLRKWLWRRVGDSNYVFKIANDSGLSGKKWIQDRKNWRIRPAMGDNGMS